MCVFGKYISWFLILELLCSHYSGYSHIGIGEAHISPLDWDVCGKNIFAMVILGFIYLGLTLLIQYNFLLKPR